MIALQSAASAVADSAIENLCADTPADERRRPDSLRPMPADFREVAPGRTDGFLEAHYSTSRIAVARWRDEIGMPRKVIRRPARTGPPADLREMSEKLHRSGLAKHYDCRLSLIDRWLEQIGAVAASPPPAGAACGLPVPDDFAARARTMTRAALARHYRRCDDTIDRWCKAAEVRPAAAKAPRHQHRPTPQAPATDGTAVSAAAHHLRRHFVVYRYDVRPLAQRKHLPNQGVGLWFVAGKGVVPPEQLIELAKGKGFDPGAWARI